MILSSEIWLAIIGAIVTVTLAFFKLLVEIRRNGELVNGRMSEMLELTRRTAHAEAQLEVAATTPPPPPPPPPILP